MMTIDEAIVHAEWCADNSCGECAEEHQQLAEWLRELKEWKKLAEGIDLRPASLMVQFQPNVNDLEAENETLRELVRHMGACIQHLDRTDEDGGCVLCPYQTPEYDCEFEQRMLELGIELYE